MTDKIQLMRELQSDMTQADFADMLGVTQPYLSMIYAGTREPGIAVVKGLLREFPEQRDTITGVFFSEIITEKG